MIFVRYVNCSHASCMLRKWITICYCLSIYSHNCNDYTTAWTDELLQIHG